MDEKKREEIALFRYSLIVPFLSQEELEWGVKSEILQRMVTQIHLIPHSEKQSLTEGTIRRYLAQYKAHGFEGLKPQDRSDIGTSHKIPPEILEQAFLLKREEPRRGTEKIIHLMEAHQIAPPGVVKRSTLHRIFVENGLTAKELKKATNSEFRPFQADYPNQIWQSDVMYGPYLPDPDRPAAKKRTYLVAIIDDFSRKVLHSEFYWDEKLPALENTFQKAILKCGIPEVFYIDNGKIFSAHQMNLVCADLGIRKIHCERYRPQGKGKIERFFQTVRRDFLTELQHEKVIRLEALNQKYWAWLEVDYHHKIHSITKETPQNHWRQHVTGHLRKIDEKQLNEIFLWRVNRKVTKTGLVAVKGIEFEVQSFLAGKKVQVRFNHFDLAEVAIYFNERFIQKAKPVKISRWNTAQKKKAPTQTTPPKSNINHLAWLEQKHHQQKVEQANVLLGKKLPQNEFTMAHFIKNVATALDRKVETLHPNELKLLENAWQTYGPFQPALIHTAMAKAIIKKNNAQHLSFYIQAIIDVHINAQSQSQEDTK